MALSEVQFDAVTDWMSATIASAAMAIVRAAVATCPVNPALKVEPTRALLTFPSGARKACNPAVVMGLASLRSIVVVSELNGDTILRNTAASRFIVVVWTTVVVGAVVVGRLVGVVVVGVAALPPHEAPAIATAASAVATLMNLFMRSLQFS
jgi:hypothetical protein